MRIDLRSILIGLFVFLSCSGKAFAQEGLIVIPDVLQHQPHQDMVTELTILDEKAELGTDVEVFFPDTSVVRLLEVVHRGDDRLQLVVEVKKDARVPGPQPFFVRTGREGASFRQAQLRVHGQRPTLNRVQLRSGPVLRDTLDLSQPSLHAFDLVLNGSHFYRGSKVVFEDSASFKMQRPVFDDTSDSLVVRVVVQGRPARVQPLAFRVVHPHSDPMYDGWLPVRARPPKITDIQPSRFQAGRSRERVTVFGEGFAPGASVRIPEIPWADVSSASFSEGSLQFDARIPADLRMVTVIVENEDGQEARRTVPVTRDLQPAQVSVRNRHGRLFFGQIQRLEFRAEGDAAFEPRRQYILDIEGVNPLYVQPQSEGVILAEVQVNEQPGSYNASGRQERSFTIKSMDGAREWSGLLDVYFPPRIKQDSTIVIRPGERLTLSVSGLYLNEAQLISDTGVIRSTKVLTDQTLEVVFAARADIQPGTFNMYLVRDDYRFQTLTAQIRPWAEPERYVSWGWNKQTRRERVPWEEANEFLKVASNSQVVFNIEGSKLPPDARPQRLHLQVKNNAINTVLHNERYVIAPGVNETVLIDLEGKVEPEQTLRVSLATPQDSTNFNLVRVVRSPRERWDIAAGASVVRVAFNGDVQVLNSVGLGATYALDEKNDLGLNMGGLFIGYEDRVVDFGLTSSLTFFKRLTLGFGWNILGPGAKTTEGSLFERRGFMIVGGTFNLALP